MAMQMEVLIAGANPQVNLTDVSLSSIHMVAGDEANVRLVRVQSDLKLEKVEDAVLKYQQSATVTARQTSSATFDWTCPLTPVTLTAKKEPLVFSVGEQTSGDFPCNGCFFQLSILSLKALQNGTLWVRGPRISELVVARNT